MDESSIQFDESGEFQFFASFGQCGFRDAPFYGFPSAQRLEKEVQLHLVGVLRDVYEKSNQIMEGQLPVSGEIGRILLMAVNEFV